MVSKITTAEEALFMIKVAEIARRPDDMLEFAVLFIKLKEKELTKEEQTLIINTFKNLTKSKRKLMRRICEDEERLKNDKSFQRNDFVKEVLADEIYEICKKGIDLIDEHLLKYSTTDRSKIVYLKTKADFFRYICEITKYSDHNVAIEEAEFAYVKAKNLADKVLPFYDVVRIGLAVNYTAFLVETKGNYSVGCLTARGIHMMSLECFAKQDLDEEEHKEALDMLRILKHNLMRWKALGRDYFT